MSSSLLERSTLLDTAATAAPVLADPTVRRFGTGRVLLLVFGSITLVAALAALAGGGVAVWALAQRDGAGYFTSGAHRLSTGSYALATDNLDIGADAPGCVFHDHSGTIRI